MMTTSPPDERVMDQRPVNRSDVNPRRLAVRRRNDCSNELAEVAFDDGRVLILKWTRHRTLLPLALRTAQQAARLVRERADIPVPEYVELPHRPGETPVLAYWRIPHPTLKETWPHLGAMAREKATREWGALLRRMHAINLPGHGPLLQALEIERTLGEFLRDDLGERLRSAAQVEWPAVGEVISRLLEWIPEAEARAESRARLLHGDLHSANVLCDPTGDEIQVTGVIDLDDAWAGPPEAELARIEVLHGPLFGQPLPAPWFECLAEGYGGAFDELLLGFFRVYQLLNLGYHAAATGLSAHAADVARAAEGEARALNSRGCRHTAVLASS
jgi:aminoglycoside phosphotransferase (APT) family kinase protein